MNAWLPSDVGVSLIVATWHSDRPCGMSLEHGLLFVDHTGRIDHTGVLPIHCGGFPRPSVVKIPPKSPTFPMLRNSGRLDGKRGIRELAKRMQRFSRSCVRGQWKHDVRTAQLQLFSSRC
ncbi:hypothetical protein K227x_34320 [Rubripirellula lacrimiformis]|uniref:Uncharacterized protein n=1 Tax=Rubripirellula lacrimiformis TaxID=1930273 RepID=A0A517ND20_9BACT|nr:hypothetical protein K227x_34320 [Rubripirellula lacrimiformis]